MEPPRCLEPLVPARLVLILALALAASLLGSVTAVAQVAAPSGRVVFPTDALTVADGSQSTGLRVSLPLPDCAVARSACDEIALINTLDGFDIDPRIEVQLDSAPPSDPAMLAAMFDEETLHVQQVGTSERIGLNRFVLDPATNRLYGSPVEQLREATRYRAVYRGAAVEFTTLSATRGLAQMRQQLDDGRAYDAAGIPAGQRGISFVQGDVRTAFRAANVVRINRYNEVVPRGELRPETVIDTAKLLSSASTYAFGSLRVPSWLDADATIPAGATLGSGPRVRGSEEIGVTVILPEGPKPPGGWPTAIFGPGITRSKYDIYLVADLNASRGIATVSFDPVGHAFGPRSEVGVQLSTAQDEVRFSGFGRGRDMNNDGVITNQEGVQAPIPPHPKAAVGLRDGLRQSAADAMAIARAIRLGADVDGDGEVDLDGDLISFYALSLGGIYGSMLMGADPSIEVAVLNVPGGPIADIARLGSYRFALIAQLRNRIPAQLNGGRSQFTEDRPIFVDPPVTQPAAGAIAIQDTLTRANWISRPGSPEAFAPHIPQPKRVIYQFAWGDQTVPNPTSATLARAFGHLDRVTFYRHDQTPGGAAGQNPHGILADPTIVPGREQAQAQATDWIANRGEGEPLHPGFPWETPIADRDALERRNVPEEVLGPEVAAPARELVRLGGANRVATAALISGERFDEADTVLIARADVYADALAGGPLAVHRGAPLLLSGSDALSEEAAAEIERLGAQTAVLLGGAAALSPQVQEDLEALGLDVERVEGPNRFATAAAVAAALPFSPEVFVVEGEHTDRSRGWPDALSASAVASSLAQPILLVNRDRLPDETAEALTADVNATIVGGVSAVGETVAAQVAAEVNDVLRVAGPDRYATSEAMVTEGLRRGLDLSATYLATGRDFADGLVAGAAAGSQRGLLLLVDGTSLSHAPAARAWLADHSRGFETVRVAGGPVAISGTVEEEVRALLR